MRKALFVLLMAASGAGCSEGGYPVQPTAPFKHTEVPFDASYWKPMHGLPPGPEMQTLAMEAIDSRAVIAVSEAEGFRPLRSAHVLLQQLENTMPAQNAKVGPLDDDALIRKIVMPPGWACRHYQVMPNPMEIEVSQTSCVMSEMSRWRAVAVMAHLDLTPVELSKINRVTANIKSD